MKAPYWKRLLSYVYEFHIESTSSEHNPHLYVSLSKGRYQLCTSNAIYSFADLYDNFSLAFEKIKLDKIGIDKVLILGFGLGSIPIILEKMGKDFQYVAIEIDEEVLYFANKYALPEIRSTLQMICADAYHYVRQSQEKFDLICVDIFLDDVIPHQFEQDFFLQQIDDLLTPNGIVMYNRLAYTTDDIDSAKIFYESQFLSQFPKGTYLDVNKNWMLLSRKDIVR